METSEALKGVLLKQAEARVETLILKLLERKTGELEELEQEILAQIMLLGQTWLQTILQEQAQVADSRASKEGACGHRLEVVGKRPRQLLSVFGPISIRRTYSHCGEPRETSEQEENELCRRGMVPFDRAWGLTGQRSSPGVQRLVSYLSAALTHEAVSQSLEKFLPLHLSARQIGNILQPVGEAFEQEEEREMQQLMEQAACKQSSEAEQQAEQGEPIKRLYVEMDGVMARLRRGSVPMEREEQARQGDVYREVKVGAVFVGESGHERSTIAPGVFVDHAGCKRYVARRTTAEEFAKRIYALAHAEGVQRATEVVVLGDGAKWIWGIAEEQFPGAVQIVDEYHAREHVWNVAHAAFPTQTAARETWAKAVNEQLAHGQVEEVIAAIERLAPLAPEPGQSRSPLVIEADYFRTNAHRMRYLAFREKGMHIGSGIAEAACKSVVSTRAKQSGMRWTPHGLDAILALRTTVLNQDFDQTWQASRKAA